ncbi:Ohr family peroxiredoxin [Massilia sp. RP-1-19]|uniref:Ohr family peroxiredoxin n=1 Tax=Massilia polaris TaxID=2728846 RepID=A0A848HNC5_9BURK|nr:Ohr family peroxiredoxin [Massilia polaris]NML61670.1 Ohr family peroxiredoxin [Massilia polaris]
MSKIEKVLVTGKSNTTASGGHGGNVTIKTSSPGNSAARGDVFEAIPPHPMAEQLFAGAWSACYSAAVALVAKEKNVTLPDGMAVEIEVDLGQTGDAYFIQGRINLIVPGLAHDVATAIAHAADQVCPYSKATRGNIDVVVRVTTA